MPKQVTNTVVDVAFFDQEKAKLPAIRKSQEPMLLTKSKINPGVGELPYKKDGAPRRTF